MYRTLRLIFFSLLLVACAAALAAGDAQPVPAKLDAAYRTYLAGLAKAYQAETAKFDAQLKHEAAAAKRDPELSAAVAAMQQKIKDGKQLDDLAALVTGDLLDSGKVTGMGETAFVGSWDIDATNDYAPGTVWTLVARADHSATEDVLSPGMRHTNHYRWQMQKGSQIAITICDDGFAYRQWLIDLPIPTTGPVTIADHYLGKGPNAGRNSDRIMHATRHVDAVKAAP